MALKVPQDRPRPRSDSPQGPIKDLAMTGGTLLNVENRDGVLQMTPVDAEFSRQVEAFLRTHPQHRRSYRELAR